jgi:hypothetical protein
MIKYTLSLLLLITAFSSHAQTKPVRVASYLDTAYIQDYSVKYYLESPAIELLKAFTDRNGNVQLLANTGLQHVSEGRFLYPGKIVEDHSYRFMTDKKVVDMTVCKQQFVYLDEHVILSNAWAGSLYVKHEIVKPKLFAGNDNLSFLVSDGRNINLIQDAKVAWRGSIGDGEIIQIINRDQKENSFLILTATSVYSFSAANKRLEKIYQGEELTAFDINKSGNRLVIGSRKGYLVYDLKEGKQLDPLHDKLPSTEITAVKILGDKLWFGTTKGAFTVNKNNQIDYYASERWLPNDYVLQISPGKDGHVLVLTKSGIGAICFKKMSLREKADFYDQQVRSRHIRNGFNASLVKMDKGNLSTGYMSDSDNDGLWTSMYLASQVFRYSTTSEPEALKNCIESLDALERLYTINPIPGFPARSFERTGHNDKLADHDRWQQSPDPEWVWKTTTSSDEVIGHFFALSLIADIVDNKPAKDKAIRLIDTLMGHIVKNNLYLIDYDGKPTLWGKWNPEYVNSFPTNVGDRKLNSSNIIAMLQTAYRFTKKEKYKAKAMELISKYGYLENLMRPMAGIGQAGSNTDEWSKHLSGDWNHSDDEMYFVGYWGLYRYALNDDLKAKYKKAIVDHWQIERPEKEGAWNIITAITGVSDFDLDEAVWYLKEYPLDMIDWTVKNSDRKDIELLPPNFREQKTKNVLPPDELRIARHNSNRFVLDGGNGGRAEDSAGDIWLLPYWMGRYLNVIKGQK